jgi:hypothetical protein
VTCLVIWRHYAEEALNICMIGAGYLGFVSAACFSEFGWTVTCQIGDLSAFSSAKRFASLSTQATVPSIKASVGWPSKYHSGAATSAREGLALEPNAIGT